MAFCVVNKQLQNSDELIQLQRRKFSRASALSLSVSHFFPTLNLELRPLLRTTLQINLVFAEDVEDSVGVVVALLSKVITAFGRLRFRFRVYLRPLVNDLGQHG